MLKMFSVFLTLFLVAFATGASAHAVPEEAHSASIIRLLETILIAIAVFAYARGVVRIRRDVGTDRVVSRSQTFAFALAMVLFVVILSPQVDEVTDALFSAHMAQHLVLMLVIPPLLVWSRPLLVMIWGLPRSWRKDFATSTVVHWLRSAVWALMHPLLVATLFLGTFSFWHLPRPYAWSLENEWIHTFEHLSFVITAFMFWTLVIEPSGRRRMEFIPTMLFVAAIAVLSGLPGALMILSPVTLFKAHGNAALAWGLTPLEDQQIAGLIMWVPAGIFFLVPIAWLFVKSLQAAERRHAAVHSIILFAICLTPIALPSHAKAETGDASAHGKALINQYGCGMCHTIPGIDNATGRVGPPLAGIADRIFIAGRLQNNLDNMTKWISDPQSVAPGNAMPNMGIEPADARAIAAYLATLREEK
jgi:cytochrome c oxidase assembly factor CtaG/cytochrome c551/c552